MIPSLGRSGQEGPREEVGNPARLRRVMIADEALPVRRTLIEILKKMGTPESEILVATEPQEALEVFREKRPTIVFAEFLGVHAEDGLEIINEMLDFDPEAKIVLITAEARDTPEVRAAIRAGVFAFVEKPLRHEKIRAVLSDLESELGGIERFR